MSDSVMKLQLVARAEMALLKAQTRQSARRAVWMVIGGIFALIGLAMLAFAAYLSMKDALGENWAAVCVAAIAFVLALVLVLIGRGQSQPSEEERLARQIRDMAYAELDKDIQQVRNLFGSGSTDSSLGLAGLSSIGPLLDLGLGLYRRKKKRG
ncbi:phage holin family protein [Biformimicrobium ophioploci]|uniref:Holin-X, holin superfamily III n=1 Tax=Biformimicrobium ophioploci TaxID=3036711 RepID=A0ABQ6LWS3_9GAMM|nr:phage holin family protein [Microbulbifer sp. NKW57]GMG86546.1 hypothetical protein MNKW57_08670 [Microbulbifer sp. NKW57]